MTRLRALIRTVAALAATLLLIVGVPAVLVVYVGWPLPKSLPNLEEIRLALRSGIDPQLLIDTLAVIIWIVWIQLVTALAVEVVAVARGRTARRVPVLPGMQAAAARMVAAITLVAASFGPVRIPAATAGAPPLTTLVAEPVHHTQTLQPESQHQPPPPTDKTTPAPQQGGHVAYPVQRFDTLWGIAEATLGDGRRWTEIRDLNLGRPTADGQTITQTTEHLTPGTMLLLPADANLPTTPRDHNNSEDNTSAAASPPEVIVEPGDHFWAIAEQALAGAWGRQPTNAETTTYWTRLIDINRERLKPPYDPDLIYPSQVLQLPPIPDGSTQGEGPAPTEEQSTREVTVVQGDHFWVIAERTLAAAWERQPTNEETTTYWRRLIDINREQLQPPYHPDLIYPGQVFQLPPIPEHPTKSDSEEEAPVDDVSEPHDTNRSNESTTAETTEPEQSTPTESDASPSEQPPTSEISQDEIVPSKTDQSTPEADETDTPEDETGLLPTAAPLAGLGLLAAGVIALIGRLRRNQLRRRKPDTVPTPPSPTTQKTETTLRAAAAPTASEFVDLSLRALAAQVTDQHTPPPQLVGVHISSDTLRLLLWSAHNNPPEGWTVDDDGHSWTLPTGVDTTHLHLLADATPAPYPALVTVGHQKDTQLLLDLEHLGAVQVTGGPSDVAATCYTMATELAANPIADTLEVVCVGFGGDLQHLERVTVVDQVDDILPAIESKTTALSKQGVTPFQGRLAPWGGDSWTPVVILDPSSEPPQDADRMLAVAHQGRAVCAVVGYPTGGQWRLHVTDTTVEIHPLGYTYNRRNLTSSEQAAIADLTHTAKDLDGIPHEPTVDSSPPGQTTGSNQGSSLTDTGQDTDTEESSSGREASLASEALLEVQTLGTVNIKGSIRDSLQPKPLELVTYLIFHRKGVTADTLMEALWPQQPPDRHRLNSAMHRARRSLGSDPDGKPYLPHATDHVYRISPRISSDVDKLSLHIKSANTEEADEAEHLQAALELVEGPPFSGIKDGYEWAHTEGILTHIIVTVDNAAHRLADHALQDDDPDLATWAARKGLAASWACEECYRNLMRAAVARDDQTALDAIYSELTTLVDADQGPDATSWLDPETIQLYEQNSRNRRYR